MTVTRELLRRLPKAELHVHLDGCIRPATMLQLARQQGVRLPADEPDALARAMYVRDAHSLEEYLQRYQFTLAVMQTAEAMERIAYEFVLDSAADGVRYVEVRYCPALHTPSLTLAQAVEAPLAGVERGERETGTVTRLIICGLRTLPPRVSEDLARVAVDYRADRVVAFDLAGAERGHPAAEHARAFAYARAHGLPCTCHAGEGDGPESIRQALHVCGAQRIGHGTHLFEDPGLEEEVCGSGVPLEVCLTSNVHTRSVPGVSEHPMRRYLDRGCVVTLNTDSRLMDGVTLTDEYWLAHSALGCDRADIDRLILNTFASAFLPDTEKAPLIARIRRELEEIA
jgi:adenosine deaminase